MHAHNAMGEHTPGTPNHKRKITQPRRVVTVTSEGWRNDP